MASQSNRRLTDIWPESLPHRKPTGHKAEKPVGLISKVLAESGGDLTLDPIVGSGTTPVAAKQLGKKAIGIEIEERWCEFAARRIEQTAPETFLNSRSIYSKNTSNYSPVSNRLSYRVLRVYPFDHLFAFLHPSRALCAPGRGPFAPLSLSGSR